MSSKKLSKVRIANARITGFGLTCCFLLTVTVFGFARVAFAQERELSEEQIAVEDEARTNLEKFGCRTRRLREGVRLDFKKWTGSGDDAQYALAISSPLCRDNQRFHPGKDRAGKKEMKMRGKQHVPHNPTN